MDLARWAYLLLAKIVHFKKTLKARFSSATDGVSGALPYSLQGRLATFYGLECRGWAVVKSMHFMHTFEPQLWHHQRSACHTHTKDVRSHLLKCCVPAVSEGGLIAYFCNLQCTWHHRVGLGRLGLCKSSIGLAGSLSKRGVKGVKKPDPYPRLRTLTKRTRILPRIPLYFNWRWGGPIGNRLSGREPSPAHMGTRLHKWVCRGA